MTRLLRLRFFSSSESVGVFDGKVWIWRAAQHNSKERSISKYEMRIIMRAYLGASGMQRRFPVVFLSRPCGCCDVVSTFRSAFFYGGFFYFSHRNKPIASSSRCHAVVKANKAGFSVDRKTSQEKSRRAASQTLRFRLRSLCITCNCILVRGCA